MKIIKLNREIKDDIDKFLQFSVLLYGDTPFVHNCILKIKNIIKETSGYDLYMAEKDDRVVGRMSIGINENYSGSNYEHYGYVGLFDVVEDYDVFSLMIDFAKEKLADCEKILFPLHVSTWYLYRFSRKGRDNFRFFHEIPDKDYYAEFAEKYSTKETYRYKSIISHNPAGVIKKNQKGYASALEKGISFSNFKKSRAESMLRTVYEISIRAFKDNLFYIPLNWHDFYSLYKDSLRMIDEDLFTIAFNEKNEPVGFCFSTPDYTELFDRYRLDSISGKAGLFIKKNKTKGMIIKTVAVVPEYRGKGIQGALTMLHAAVAEKRNYEYIIGALIYSGNYSPEVLGKPVIEKEYELYSI